MSPQTRRGRRQRDGRRDRHTGHAYHAGHAEHAGHAGHAESARHEEHTGHASPWGVAARATAHCLTGCAIGEVLGMAVGTALGWHIAPTMALAIVLAFAFGYGLTLLAVLRAGLTFRRALRVALAADTVSITVMELVDNGVILLTPGATDSHLTDWLFWATLAFAFAVAFAVTTPVNRWLIGRGRGHAVVHRYH